MTRQKAQKDEACVDQARHPDGGSHRARTRDRHHRDAARVCPAHQRSSRIAHGRHAGVGDERDVLAALEQLQQLFDLARASVGVERMQGALGDRKVREQLARATRVFGGDVLGLLERLERPQRDVAEVADRGADQVQLADRGARCYLAQLLLPMPTASPTPTASPKFWRRCSRSLPIRRDSSWRTRSRDTPNWSPSSCSVSGSSATTRLSKISMSLPESVVRNCSSCAWSNSENSDPSAIWSGVALLEGMSSRRVVERPSASLTVASSEASARARRRSISVTSDSATFKRLAISAWLGSMPMAVRRAFSLFKLKKSLRWA